MKELEVILLVKNWTQKDLAEAAGYSTSTISQVISGQRKAWPKLRRELAKTLGVEEDFLFDEEGNLKETKATSVTIPLQGRKERR